MAAVVMAGVGEEGTAGAMGATAAAVDETAAAAEVSLAGHQAGLVEATEVVWAREAASVVEA